MAKKKDVQMPQSTAGLIRYFEESKDAIKLRPEHVVGLCVGIMAIVLALRFMV